jgi:adenosylhomocysteinase
VELDLNELKAMAAETSNVKENVDEYRMADGRTIYVLAEGRLINLSAAFGHPSEVMDMSFANQALCVQYIVENHAKLGNAVHGVPAAIDKRVAALKLEAIGIETERLTAKQETYLHSWTLGT